MVPVVVKLPNCNREPVNVVEPVTSKLPVISNVSVFKVKGVPEPDIAKEPEITSAPTNVLLPVVANDAVLAFKDDVYDSKAPKRVEALPVNVNTLALNEFSDAVCASIEALNAFILDVNAVNDAV